MALQESPSTTKSPIRAKSEDAPIDPALLDGDTLVKNETEPMNSAAQGYLLPIDLEILAMDDTGNEETTAIGQQVLDSLNAISSEDCDEQAHDNDDELVSILVV